MRQPIFEVYSREGAGTITIFEGHTIEKKTEVENEEPNEDTEDADDWFSNLSWWFLKFFNKIITFSIFPGVKTEYCGYPKLFKVSNVELGPYADFLHGRIPAVRREDISKDIISYRHIRSSYNNRYIKIYSPDISSKT